MQIFLWITAEVLRNFVIFIILQFLINFFFSKIDKLEFLVIFIIFTCICGSTVNNFLIISRILICIKTEKIQIFNDKPKVRFRKEKNTKNYSCLRRTRIIPSGSKCLPSHHQNLCVFKFTKIRFLINRNFCFFFTQ